MTKDKKVIPNKVSPEVLRALADVVGGVGNGRSCGNRDLQPV